MTTILVVEDDSIYRMLLRDILEQAGYTVIEADDGEVGMRLYRQKKPDLIITDLIMPNKEGIGLIMELKSEFQETKIIAISGGGSLGPDTLLKAARGLGAKCALQKPVERKKLLATVKECL